jgi:large subunit ribosomal protein L31
MAIHFLAVQSVRARLKHTLLLPHKEVLMKTDIHPDYKPVVFRDLASGATFLTRSTVGSSKTMEWEDGNVYPVIDVEISSESHPFYTGKQRIMDSAGRVEKFNKRFKGFGN